MLYDDVHEDDDEDVYYYEVARAVTVKDTSRAIYISEACGETCSPKRPLERRGGGREVWLSRIGRGPDLRWCGGLKRDTGWSPFDRFVLKFNCRHGGVPVSYKVINAFRKCLSKMAPEILVDVSCRH